MNLLIITQKVDKNDDMFGFFHTWLVHFAKHCTKLTVICLEKGEHDLPSHVCVVSLGKEKGVGKIGRLMRLWNYCWKYRKDYDSVFVHMNPEYVVASGILWKLLGKRIGLWYVHRSVTLKLKIAEKLADVIFTSSKESFRVPSNKLMYVKHGIDFAHFDTNSSGPTEPVVIAHIGRITTIKNCDILIEAAGMLKDKWNRSFKIVFAGRPVYDSDKAYKEKLKLRIAELHLQNIVEFAGGIAHKDLPAFLNNVSCTVNLTPSGGMDKAVIESIAASRPVFVSNNAFQDLLGEYKNRFMFAERDNNDLALKIMSYFNDQDNAKAVVALREKAKGLFDLSALIATLTQTLQK